MIQVAGREDLVPPDLHVEFLQIPGAEGIGLQAIERALKRRCSMRDATTGAIATASRSPHASSVGNPGVSARCACSRASSRRHPWVPIA